MYLFHDTLVSFAERWDIKMRNSIIDRFEEIVKEKKEEIAVEHNAENITFDNLWRESVSVANTIIKQTQIINKPIAVYLPKDISTIIADLGIIYSGNPFMNLDIKTPMDRIENIIKQIKPAVIITNSIFKDKFKDLNIIVIDIMSVKENIQVKNINVVRKNIIDTDPFCIINTSGSTGTPKGVVLNHRSFFDFVDWASEEFNFNGSEVIGSLSPAVFDIFDFELCMLIMKGSRMVLLDSNLASFPMKLLSVLDEANVNFIFWVPSIMVNIANMDLLTRIPLKSLKTVWFAGEVFPTKQFLYWYDNLPNVKFTNLYGPIEITLDCTYYTVQKRPDEIQPLPIGVPCKNTDILILNEKNELCEIDEEGELCVRGTSLAMGYYNDTEKTSKAFVQNPLNNSYYELIYRTGDMVVKDANGLIHFKGRKDTLIKHMGYRIELGEIEHLVVNDLKLVSYCCALYNNEEKIIVLYYESKEEIEPKEFRKKLSERIPTYMIPKQFKKIDLLPRNTNGKIDRLQLKNLINKKG